MLTILDVPMALVGFSLYYFEKRKKGLKIEKIKRMVGINFMDHLRFPTFCCSGSHIGLSSF